MSVVDPTHLSAAEAARAIAAGRLTASALAEACLNRIAERDPIVQAFVTLDPERVLAEAKARDAEPPRGPLHGVPIAVKDLMDTADYPTSYGSPIYRGHRPAADAACVAKVRAAGAVVLGKTVTTEFAHMHPGPTVNPHDPSRTPGGSSSGSAAAVGDFQAPIAFGTQTGGSVIRPASFCGIYGFKSTAGRTEVTGVKELAGSLDTVGWMSRDAEDLAILGRLLLVGTPAGAAPPRPPRIGFCRTPFWASAQADARSAVEAAAANLAAAGAQVEDVTLPADFAELNRLHRVVVSSEAAKAFEVEARDHPTLLSPLITAFLAEGRGFTAERRAEAYAATDKARRAADQLLGGWDALLVPAAPGEAPVGHAFTGDAVFSLFWSLLQVPAVTLPAARGPNGLPVGVQLVARRGQDEALLALTEWAAPHLVKDL